MDILQNPFGILGATTRDNRHRIMELEEERSLLLDPDECRAARETLINPLKRVSAEVAWLPRVDPKTSAEVLRYLDTPNQNLLNIARVIPNLGIRGVVPAISQNLLNITRATHIARANLLITGVSRLPNLPSSNIVEWILAIAQTSEAINSETVRAILNEDRRASGFPEITDLSVIDDEIRKQKSYYRQVLTSILEDLSVTERASILTIAIETSTGNGSSQCPILIKDLISAYETGVQDALEQKQKIIEAQDDKLRAMVDAKNADTTLTPIVDQLIQAVKEWDTLVQPIQLSKKSTGQRHDVSFKIAQRLRILAADLFGEYGKIDFARNIINMLKEVFAEIPELAEYISEDAKALEEQIPFVKIKEQVEKLKEASDTYKPDYTLRPMVNQLIQTVKTWNTITQPVEANNAVAITVRNIALHLWNEHQKLYFATKIIFALIDEFKGVDGMDEVNNRLYEDIITLGEMAKPIEQPQPRGGPGCLLQIVIFAVIGIIVALL